MFCFVIPSVGVTPILNPFLRNGRSTIKRQVKDYSAVHTESVLPIMGVVLRIWATLLTLTEIILSPTIGLLLTNPQKSIFITLLP